MDAALQRGSNVSDSGLTCFDTERCCLENKVGVASLKKPLCVGDWSCLRKPGEITAVLDAGYCVYQIDRVG